MTTGTSLQLSATSARMSSRTSHPQTSPSNIFSRTKILSSNYVPAGYLQFARCSIASQRKLSTISWYQHAINLHLNAAHTFYHIEVHITRCLRYQV